SRRRHTRSKRDWSSDVCSSDLEVMGKVVRPEAGAISTFTGITREFTHGKRTLFLEYQAYPSMAEKKLAQIGEEIEEKWGNTKTRSEERRVGKERKKQTQRDEEQ